MQTSYCEYDITFSPNKEQERKLNDVTSLFTKKTSQAQEMEFALNEEDVQTSNLNIMMMVWFIITLILVFVFVITWASDDVHRRNYALAAIILLSMFYVIKNITRM
jgi:hypothetical protein